MNGIKQCRIYLKQGIFGIVFKQLYLSNKVVKANYLPFDSVTSCAFVAYCYS